MPDGVLPPPPPIIPVAHTIFPLEDTLLLYGIVILDADQFRKNMRKEYDDLKTLDDANISDSLAPMLRYRTRWKWLRFDNGREILENLNTTVTFPSLFHGSIDILCLTDNLRDQPTEILTVEKVREIAIMCKLDPAQTRWIKSIHRKSQEMSCMGDDMLEGISQRMKAECQAFSQMTGEGLEQRIKNGTVIEDFHDDEYLSPLMYQ